MEEEVKIPLTSFFFLTSAREISFGVCKTDSGEAMEHRG